MAQRPRRWARVTEQDGRLLLAWYCADRALFAQLRSDLGATFSRHRDRCWSRRHEAWSLPAHHRALLGEWLAVWFEPEAVEWSMDQQPALAARA